MEELRLTEDQGRFLVQLARRTVMAELMLPVENLSAVKPAAIPKEPVFQEKQGVFVTLHKQGQLRGCIGSLVGVVPIIEGVRANAINAAFHDPRFKPVTAPEFDLIDFEVSVLSRPQPLAYDSVGELVGNLTPGVDGVIIRKGSVSATFLPQVWEQLPDVDQFLSHLCRKAGLAGNEWQRGGLTVLTYNVQSFTD